MPARRKPTIGRDPERLQIEEALSEGRLVTLVGPPGVGKSHIAQDVVREVSDKSYPGGVWRVDLGGSKTLEDVLHAVATTTNRSIEEGTPADFAIDLLARSIGSGLLMLDDVDSVVPIVAKFVDRWLDVEGPTLLITSRERLRIEGEVVVPIAPLSRNEAITLFVRQTRSTGATCSDADAATIVEAVDRIPLGLEIAAAHTSVLPISEIVDALHRGDLAVIPRGMSSLETAIEDSWLRLGPEQQKLLMGIAIHRCPVDLEDLRALFPDLKVASLVAELVHRSLVSTVGSYYVPYAPIRRFADRQVTEEIRRAWATTILERAEGWADDPDDTEAMVSLHVKLDDMAGAFDFLVEHDVPLAIRTAAAMWRVVAATGLYGKYAEVFDRAVAKAETTDESLEALARWTRGVLIVHVDATASMRDLERALALSRGEELEARCQLARGAVLDELGRRDEARAALEEGLEVASDDRARADLLHNLAWQALTSGELDAAARMAQESTQLRTSPVQSAPTALLAGIIDHARGLLDDAQVHYEDAGQSTMIRHRLLANILRSTLDIERGQPERAVDALVALDAASTSAGIEVDRGMALAALAAAQHRCGNCDEARGTQALARWVLERRSGYDVVLRPLDRLLKRPDVPPASRHALETIARRWTGESTSRVAIRLDVGARKVSSSEGLSLDMRRRGPMWSMLVALAEHAVKHRAEGLSLWSLLEAGWPDEKMHPDAGAQRVYTTIQRLRKLGLEPYLLRWSDGYLIDPEVDVHLD